MSPSAFGDDAEFLALVAGEVERARAKHPGRDRLEALLGEFGEVLVEVQRIKKGDFRFAELREELVQLAGTCLRFWLEGDPSVVARPEHRDPVLPISPEPEAFRSLDGFHPYHRDHILGAVPVDLFREHLSHGRHPGFSLPWFEAWVKKHPTAATVLIGRGEAPPFFLAPSIPPVSTAVFRGVFIGFEAMPLPCE